MLVFTRGHNLRVKLTLEHFREMSGQPRQRWANKPLHLVANGGTATNMADFFNGAVSRDQFRRKLAWFAKRYGDNPTVYGWELWNEVNAVRARGKSVAVGQVDRRSSPKPGPPPGASGRTTIEPW